MHLESPTTTLPRSKWFIYMVYIYAAGGGIIALLLCVCLICCAVIWSVLLYLKICFVTYSCFFSRKCCFKRSKYKLKKETGIPELYTFVQEIKQEPGNDNIIDSSHLDLMGKLK